MNNIVCSGARYQIYGGEIKTYTSLPVGSYEVSFNPMTGFSLTERKDLFSNEEKIYGDRSKKVEKVFNSFGIAERNLGVIISGKKGIGKSLFARMIAEEAVEIGYPVIIVSDAAPGIANFISSIDQEVVVIFDEFDKTFYDVSMDDSDSASSMQDSLLPLFDGLDNGKKLFVITCNNTDRLSSYIMNRPGRFHYHFSFKNPSIEEVSEYMRDKLKPEFYSQIKGIIKLATVSDITYDMLRALAFEINQGYSLNECLEDMNIFYEHASQVEITAHVENGDIFAGRGSVDIYNPERRPTFLLYNKIGDSMVISMSGGEINFGDHGADIDVKSVSVKYISITVGTYRKEIGGEEAIGSGYAPTRVEVSFVKNEWDDSRVQRFGF